MNGKEFAFMMVGIAFCIAFGAAAYRYSESLESIESAKAGLEQCPVLNSVGIPVQIVWKRECK